MFILTYFQTIFPLPPAPTHLPPPAHPEQLSLRGAAHHPGGGAHPGVTQGGEGAAPEEVRGSGGVPHQEEQAGGGERGAPKEGGQGHARPGEAGKGGHCATPGGQSR